MKKLQLPLDSNEIIITLSSKVKFNIGSANVDVFVRIPKHKNLQKRLHNMDIRCNYYPYLSFCSFLAKKYRIMLLEKDTTINKIVKDYIDNPISNNSICLDFGNNVNAYGMNKCIIEVIYILSNILDIDCDNDFNIFYDKMNNKVNKARDSDIKRILKYRNDEINKIRSVEKNKSQIIKFIKTLVEVGKIKRQKNNKSILRYKQFKLRLGQIDEGKKELFNKMYRKGIVPIDCGHYTYDNSDLINKIIDPMIIKAYNSTDISKKYNLYVI